MQNQNCKYLKNKHKKDTCVVRYQAYTCVVSNFIPVLFCYLIVYRVIIIPESSGIAIKKYGLIMGDFWSTFPKINIMD